MKTLYTRCTKHVSCTIKASLVDEATATAPAVTVSKDLAASIATQFKPGTMRVIAVDHMTGDLSLGDI